MDTLDKLIKKQNDPMEKRRQLAMLKTGMRG
ncbi:phage protein, partial [Bacillus sonorensis]|nr:phage protein [Bacillus sonorensis]MBG9915658.1 phage protein [Bacillus sonorensis]